GEGAIAAEAVVGKLAATDQRGPAGGGGDLLVIDETHRPAAVEEPREGRQPPRCEPRVQHRDARTVERQTRDALDRHSATSAGRFASSDRTPASSVAIVPSDSRAPNA